MLSWPDDSWMGMLCFLFLKMGITEAIFHSGGILPSSSVFVNINDCGLLNWNIASFNTLGFRLSGPADLDGLNDINLLNTSSGVIEISERFCMKVWSGKYGILSVFSKAKMLLKYISIYAQKQPSCKKNGVAHVKNDSMKKLWNPRWRPRSGFDGRIMAKFLIQKIRIQRIQANLCAAAPFLHLGYFCVDISLLFLN